MSELFGTAGGARDGFAALATLDSNGDGKIDASDAAFGSLRVWVDANCDAVTDQGEAKTLAELGIVSINLASQASQQTIAGNSVLAIGSYTLADGTTREIADVGFANSTTYTTATTTIPVSAEIAALPDLHGYGTVAGLQQAMAGNTALKSLVQAFAALPATTAYADVMAAVQAIMFEWAGVTAVDPNSRGGLFDARKLAFMERYLGDALTFTGSGRASSNPSSLSSAILSQAWADLQSGTAARLVLQGPLSAYRGDFTFDAAMDLIYPATDLTAALADMSQRLGPLTTASLGVWRQAALVIDGMRQDLRLDPVAFMQLVAAATTPNIAALVSAAGNSLTVQIDAAGKLTVSDPNWAASVDWRTTNLALATPARTFAAVTGDSKEVGVSGSDTFLFNAGGGHLEIDAAVRVRLAAQTNVLKLGTGLNAADFYRTNSANPDDVVLVNRVTGDRITLDGEGTDTTRGVGSVQFADGTVWTRQQLLAVAITGTADAEALYGTTNADTIDGRGAPAGSQDYVRGGGGGDTFIFNAGYGQLEVDEADYSSAPNNVLRLGTGIVAAQVTVTGDSSGNIVLTDGTSGDQVKLDYELSGQYYGVQQVQFADGTTWSKAQLIDLATTGTAGADKLYGTSGADIFDGGGAPAGSQDYARGDGGGDTFIYNPGYGQLEVDETEYSSASNNVLRFGTGITAAQITVTGDSSGHVTLTDGTSGDRIKLDYQLGGQYYGVQQVQFADGTIWSKAQLIGLATTGTAGADKLYGSPGADTFDGKGGADYVRGSGGGDTFVFNAGYGQLEVDEADYSSAPNNVLKLGAGITADQITVAGDSSGSIVLTDGTSGDQVKLNNELSGQYHGVQQIQFADGTTWSKAQLIGLATTGTAGADKLYGSSDADTLDGKGIVSYAHGGGGGDTFVFNAGYGHLEVDEADYSSAPNNVLRFGTGIVAAQVTVTGDSSGHVTLTNRTAGDQVKLDYELNGQYYGVQQVQFADGTMWSKSQLVMMATTGTVRTDALYGTSVADVFDARGASVGGHDYVHGGGGGDTFVFNAGYGHLEVDEADYSLAPNNVLRFGTGVTAAQVTVTGDSHGNIILMDGTSGDQIKLDYELGEQYYGVQTVQFADGTTWSKAQLIGLATAGTPGTDRLYGSSGADVFDGLGDADYECGSGGGDTFVYNAGYGHLEVDEIEYSSAPNNLLKLGTGITADQVTVTSDSSGNIVLTDGTAGDQIKLDYELGGQYYGVQQVQFEDGTTWSKAQLVIMATTGTAGADKLYGTDSADTFDGKGAPAGGQDYVRGSGGGDTFVYNVGYGQLEVDETEYSSAPNNVLKFGAGITADQVTVTGDSSGHVYIAYGTAGDQVKLDYQMSDSYHGVQQVQFADGTTWSKAQLTSLATPSTAGPDVLYGTSGADIFDGKGAPVGVQDYIRGGGGGDTFVFNRGYGQLEVSEADYGRMSPNILQLGPTIAPSEVTVEADAGGNILLRIGANGDQVLLDGMAPDPALGVQQVRFADGTIWDRPALIAKQMTGTAGANVIYGTSGADLIDGQGGADTVHGQGGGDTFVFDAGYGRLEVDETDFGFDPRNLLQLGTGIAPSDLAVAADAQGNLVLTIGGGGDQVVLDGMVYSPSSGVQQVRFADGTVLTAQQLMVLASTGTAGADYLYGTAGDDTLDGKGAPAGLQDYLQGNGGADTFVFNAGYGRLEINEDAGFWTNSAATLQLGAGIALATLTVSRDASGNVFLTDGTAGDQVTLDAMLTADWAGHTQHGVARVQFADGTVLSRQQIADLMMAGTVDAETLYGTAGAEVLDGKGAPAGLQDNLQGGGGADTFVFNAGYGHLEVGEDAGSYTNSAATLQFGAGVTPASLGVSTDVYGNLFLTDGVVGDQVKVDGMLNLGYADYGGSDTYTEYGVGQVQFADGTTWTRSQVAALAGMGTAGSDTLAGTSGNDLLDGRGGGDTISGGGGNDVYFIRQGYGTLAIDNTTPSGVAVQGEVDFGLGITEQNLWFSRSGDDLIASVLGSADAVDVQGWFGTNPSAQLAGFKAFDGLKLDGQVGQLTTAMAAYAGSNPGFDPATAMAMPDDPALRSVLAASWHG